MLPRTLCRLNTVPGNPIRPRYLGERDHAWLGALLEEHARFAGKRRVELAERLREPLPVRVAKPKLLLAIQVLERTLGGRVEAALPPPEARFALFRRAAGHHEPRARSVAAVARELGVGADALEAALFADLRSEQRVRAVPDDLTPARLALEVNSALVAGLLARAARVRIRAWGETGPLVRNTRRSGLICSVRSGKGVTLDISGPFALFRHTALYRRALSALVPRLSRCDGFELSAECALGAGDRLETAAVRSNDPLAPAGEPAGVERRVEQRFAAEFPRLARQWELIREPPPLVVDGVLFCADFALVHRHDPDRRWLVELAGYWTQDFLAQKLELLRAAGVERALICVDVDKGCANAPGIESGQVVCYRRRLDAAHVLSIIER